MILQSVSFRWRPEVTAEQVSALTDALSRLPAQIPVLLSYHFGPDLGPREGNADYAVIALLQNLEDVDTYVDHPAHVEFSRQHTGDGGVAVGSSVRPTRKRGPRSLTVCLAERLSARRH
ncbi:Dabb family protein [Mycolicibacterium goodii]|uniref:Dabb family protein n=1 Tax=Mycolicibacterium goodii TaxID=134601 RepID=UPI00257E1CBB|nr:Dabb family protein [Mycolicibacterium goodii]